MVGDMSSQSGHRPLSCVNPAEERDATKLIVMLTHHDRTVSNAREVFEQCEECRVSMWGMKDEGLPLRQMKRLFADMHECGKTTVLEVVAYAQDKCLAGAEMALECGCDVLMGTTYSDAVNDLCHRHSIKYMPFVGDVSGRPSVLWGTIDDMISQANQCLARDVYGFDLLGYRYTGDPTLLNASFVNGVKAPVCLAGSINSHERLDEVKAARPWAFTIGGAFFEHVFGLTHREQISRVVDYVGVG